MSTHIRVANAAIRALALLSFALALTPAGNAGWSAEEIEEDVIPALKLPEGFKASLYAHGLETPRQLAVAPDGRVFVGSRSGPTYALEDSDGDGKADVYRAAGGFAAPNGVAIHGEDLYIGDISTIYMVRGGAAGLPEGSSPPVERVIEGLYNSPHHGYRYLGVRDERLYVGLGVPCNVCEPPDPELTGTIRSYALDGSDPRTHAYGVRNSVGFDWHPDTGQLWFTDNGRDWLGDELPYDELNRIVEDGQHYGFPYCHQGDFQDPDYDERSCDEFVAPVLLTGPHVANLGMRFVEGEMFPAEYRNDVLIALHGSWNRSKKIGYAVYIARLDEDGEVTSYEPFVEGWLEGESVSGRPVDLAFMPDGSLLLSDDYTGVIYRITYEG